MKFIKICITGFLFIWFGIICIFGNLLFCPIILLGLQKYKFVRRFSRFLVRNAWGFFIFFTEFLGYQHSNASILKTVGRPGEIIISNHPSLLDIVFFLSKIKNANCIVKGELEKNIFLFAAIKACGYIPNTNNEEFLNKACEALKNGEILVMFPEGSRTKDEIVFHKAAAYIAIKSAKYLTPIYLDMKPRSLKKGEAWYKTPANTINYKFKVLPSIQIDDFSTQKPDPIRARALHNCLKEIYNEEFKNDR
ncbi:lysophospholipid acyltransferase [Campylobacter iguaniorum]|uniref:Lysophospholipid acyltransferase n=1 Tax=Campylobacter iguaniorum TaxID=1244531 RepID=A0A076FB73_9BACT|nr:lysophospholipid acyltransferase family protein [Campylobacter iguaniorum]AII15495.1 lysophospholipid acyltransferase [Campylobacter iguaniorum]